MPHHPARWMTPLLAALLGLGGCAYLEEWNLPLFTQSGKSLPAEQGEAGSGQRTARTYPEDVERGKALDIEVVRVDNAIKLLNRTTQTYQDAELWLNHEYGAPITGIGTGENEPISLQSFVNEHGERYPLGVFLAPDRDEALVEADLIVNGVSHPLPVRLQEDWSKPQSR